MGAVAILAITYMEVSYCTFRFDAIIWRDVHILSLPCDSLRDNLYEWVI